MGSFGKNDEKLVEKGQAKLGQIFNHFDKKKGIFL